MTSQSYVMGSSSLPLATIATTIIPHFRARRDQVDTPPSFQTSFPSREAEAEEKAWKGVQSSDEVGGGFVHDWVSE